MYVLTLNNFVANFDNPLAYVASNSARSARVEANSLLNSPPPLIKCLRSSNPSWLVEVAVSLLPFTMELMRCKAKVDLRKFGKFDTVSLVDMMAEAAKISGKMQ